MWIISLLEYITGFIPRPLLIGPDEGGYRQVPKPWGGCWLHEVRPNNWYWFVPWFSEIVTCKTRTQPKDVRAQSVWTKDGHNLAASVSVQYYISDPMKALLEVYDYDQSLQTIVLSVVCEFIETRTMQELKEQMVGLKEELTRATRDATKGWGLKIQKVGITDIGETQNFRHLISGLDQLEIG